MIVSTVQAQRSFYYFSAGAQIGTSHYQGDLDDHGFELWRRPGSNAFKQRLLQPAIGFQVNYHFNPFMFIRAGLNFGSIGAADSLNTDAARHWRNLSFQSPLRELSLQMIIELRGKNNFFERRSKWAPYILFGVAVYHFNPSTLPNPDWVKRYPRLFRNATDRIDLQPLGTEGQNSPPEIREQFGMPDPYSLVGISIPLGVGVRIRLGYFWDLRIDASLRKTFTDYLDDVSGFNYANPDLLLRYNTDERSYLFADRSGYVNFGVDRTPDFYNPNNHKHYGGYGFKGEIRGNRDDKDMYGFISIGITRILKQGIGDPRYKCQVKKNNNKRTKGSRHNNQP